MADEKCWREGVPSPIVFASVRNPKKRMELGDIFVAWFVQSVRK